jgi:NDP-sugar pyrophosphorylase family protein
MEINLSLRENKSEEKISAIILCAGEGKRISDFIQNIPKPLIKVKDKPLLLHIISNLSKQSLRSIIIITGHLGDEIEKYISSIEKINISLYKKIKVINSGENYKKGPLYSFLSIKNDGTIIRRNIIFLLIPGDTYFNPDIYTEIFDKILGNLNTFKAKSLIFYQKIQGNIVKSKADSEKRISIIKLEQQKSEDIINEIIQKKLFEIDDDEEVNQLLPILAFNYKLVNRILNAEKKISGSTIREIINYIIQQKKHLFYAISINPQYRFYDIDTQSDLINIR